LAVGVIPVVVHFLSSFEPDLFQRPALCLVATRRLAWGLELKGGKFLSHFGRLNAQHTHQWDFADAPLVYAAFFGESLLNEKGVRLTWVTPLDMYCMLGGEIFQGENPMSFGRSGYSDQRGTVSVRESDGPDLALARRRGPLRTARLPLSRSRTR